VELLAEEGARVLAGALPRLVTAPSDLDARSDALYGAWLAGWLLGATTMGLHHRICHVLGGAYDLPHAGLHAALLPFVAAYNAPAAPAAMARLARALGAGDPARALGQLARDLGAPTSLAMIGFDPGRIDEAAQSVVTPRLANPRPVSESDVRELLAAAHRGTLR
jgi:maleylacetate reductase